MTAPTIDPPRVEHAVTIDGLTIVVHGFDDLTAKGARIVARLLLEAAERLDERNAQ